MKKSPPFLSARASARDLTDKDIFDWQMRKSAGAPLTGVTITLRIRLPEFPIERVSVHLREEIFLAKLRVDSFWREGCELGRRAIEAIGAS